MNMHLYINEYLLYFVLFYYIYLNEYRHIHDGKLCSIVE